MPAFPKKSKRQVLARILAEELTFHEYGDVGPEECLQFASGLSDDKLANTLEEVILRLPELNGLNLGESDDGDALPELETPTARERCEVTVGNLDAGDFFVQFGGQFVFMVIDADSAKFHGLNRDSVYGVAYTGHVISPRLEQIVFHATRSDQDANIQSGLQWHAGLSGGGHV